jgi:hypothetical protein
MLSRSHVFYIGVPTTKSILLIALVKNPFLLVKEIKKSDTKDFFDCVQDTKEQDSIQDKADNEPDPPIQPGSRDNYVRQGISNEDRTKNADKKNRPFPDRLHIHVKY